LVTDVEGIGVKQALDDDLLKCPARPAADFISSRACREARHGPTSPGLTARTRARSVLRQVRDQIVTFVHFTLLFKQLLHERRPYANGVRLVKRVPSVGQIIDKRFSFLFGNQNSS